MTELLILYTSQSESQRSQALYLGLVTVFRFFWQMKSNVTILFLGMFSGSVSNSQRQVFNMEIAPMLYSEPDNDHI